MIHLNFDELTVQYSQVSEEAFSAFEKSLRQGGLPQNVGDYSIQNLMGVNKPFSVRILVKNNPKWGESILDSEIAGQNTLVSYRQGLTIGNIAFNIKQVGIHNVRLMKIEN